MKAWCERVCRILVLGLLCSSLAQAAPEQASTLINPLNTEHKDSTTMSQKELQDELVSINTTLTQSNNPWLKRYTDYANYNRIMRQMHTLQDEILHIDATNISALNEKRLAIETLERQLDLLKDAKSDPFKDLIQKPEIGDLPNITNPFAIISGLSFINNLQNTKAAFESNKQSLEIVLTLIERKYSLLEQLSKSHKNYAKELALVQAELLEVSKCL